jgi:hypothetical protein
VIEQLKQSPGLWTKGKVEDRRSPRISRLDLDIANRPDEMDVCEQLSFFARFRQKRYSVPSDHGAQPKFEDGEYCASFEQYH